MNDDLKQLQDNMNARFDSLESRIADVRQVVGVLHEDVKSDFRFTLEAQQGLKEVMDAGFANQERSFREALAPIADAVRSSNRK